MAHLGSPALAKPATVFPDSLVSHTDLVKIVREQYDLASPSGPSPELASWQRQLDVAERMSRNLAIDHHPLLLPVEEIVRPRGFGERNAQALAAIHALAPEAIRGALHNAGLALRDVDALLLTCSTAVGMPSIAASVAELGGLAPDIDLMPFSGMGCVGGGHAIARAREYALARPGRTVLIVAADIASPWFYVEKDARDRELTGSFVSASLFSDGVGAAVMSVAPAWHGDRFEIQATCSVTVPNTADAIAWRVRDDGLHFSLTDAGVKSVPGILPALRDLLDDLGWTVADLSACGFHTGGNKSIADVQRGLGLSDAQMRATRACLCKGNTMSVAVLDALATIADDPELRPAAGMPGIGAGFGPGFAAAAFAWRFRPAQAR